MSITIVLSRKWTAKGWKVKIRDRERLEPPHVAILRRTLAWRIDLRTWRLLDSDPDPRDLPKPIVEELRKSQDALCRAWDEMYPGNPVRLRKRAQ